MVLPSHGANPMRLYESYGLQPPDIIYDFSENVNPVGPPASIQENWMRLFELVSKYPDPNGEPFLSKVSAFHGVLPENIVLGNGASEIFAVLARRYTGKRVIVVHPTFSEYESTLTAAGAEIIDIVVEDIASWRIPVDVVKNEMVRCDAIYLCTPNNPTGVLPDRAVLMDLIAHGREVDCEVILDEAFIDWVDERASCIFLISENPHVMVVRSMTKLYAIPGIRLGYLVGDAQICGELKWQMPHWHINGLAAFIGAECLESVDYSREAVRYAKIQREQLCAFLNDFGCEVSQSVTNYVAFRLPEGAESVSFFHYCLEQGIVLRHSFNFTGMNGEWFRIGIKEESAMQVLRQVVGEWFEMDK